MIHPKNLKNNKDLPAAKKKRVEAVQFIKLIKNQEGSWD